MEPITREQVHILEVIMLNIDLPTATWQEFFSRSANRRIDRFTQLTSTEAEQVIVRLRGFQRGEIRNLMNFDNPLGDYGKYGFVHVETLCEVLDEMAAKTPDSFVAEIYQDASDILKAVAVTRLNDSGALIDCVRDNYIAVEDYQPYSQEESLWQSVIDLITARSVDVYGNPFDPAKGSGV